MSLFRFVILFFVVVKVAFASEPPPRLVVAIVVDQLRSDYLERFHDQFTTNGFRLLTGRGAFMASAHYDYFPTITAPGHASIFAGSPPAMHGIMGNEWYDKRAGKNIYCVADSSVIGVGCATNKSQMSPKNLIGNTFADEFRFRFQSKVVGISMKDRGAVLPAGAKPAGAYWYDSESGKFVTSSYYKTELPDWVNEFNARKIPSSLAGVKWPRLLEHHRYEYPDDAKGEGNLPGETNAVFIHTLNYATNTFGELLNTPFSNDLLAEFALATIDGENLGGGTRPDLLCISFSAIDSIGHRFGPYSQEVQDALLRLDRNLSRIFSRISEKVGPENFYVMLTADHAVCPTPEFATEQGIRGRRFDIEAFTKELSEKLNKRFGAGPYFLTTNLSNGHLFLNHVTLRDKGLSVEEVSKLLREAAYDTGRFQACFTREQLLDGRAPGFLGRMVLNGYNPERGGDLVFVLKPYVIPGTGSTGTTHGSPYIYDTHVPVLFYGKVFKPGRYLHPFDISDIAPTLAAALNLTPPAGATGAPFFTALKFASGN